MSRIVVRNLTKKFGDVIALDNVSFEAKDEKILTLLGPSGCGKTTCLRCIAGLEDPDDGEIRVGDTVIVSVEKGILISPEKRRMGLVFQSYALWPHMSVFRNIAYGLRIKKVPKKEIKKKIGSMLTLVGLEGLGDRYPAQLSGGQQQRVALARSLIYEPEILLLDEPLSNLDAKLREKVRFWLLRLQRKLKITTIYVTHDQEEAMALSDEIAVINRGKIVQLATPKEIYDEPKNVFVADFVGSANIFPATVLHPADGLNRYYLKVFGKEKIVCSLDKDLNAGEEIYIVVRPENVEIVRPTSKDEENIIQSVIEGVNYLGKYTRVLTRVHTEEIRVEVRGRRKLKIGSEVRLKIPPDACKLTSFG